METETLVDLDKPKLRVKISKEVKATTTFEQDVMAGFSSEQKYLQPKYLYDAIGSHLFEDICELPEYYPTRTEDAIIRQNAKAIAHFTSDRIVLIELGSGSSTKTRRLINAFLHKQGRLHYIPIDISKTMLVKSAKALLRKYENLQITALASEYLTALQTLGELKMPRKLILFLGSSLGNFNPAERERFLQKTRAAMNADDRMLLGVDLLKDKSILEPAYDDAQGVTAEFNLNLLARINRELDGEFDLSKFRHKAFLNEEKHRIEIHIESLENQEVHIGRLNRSFKFKRGETIHTENSYKFSPDDIETMMDHSGFQVEQRWYDAQKWFSLLLLQPA